MENFNIRKESPKDYSNLYSLIKTAFETARVSDGNEQDFAEKLRNSEKYIPDLALVAEYNNQLIGHIMLTKTSVKTTEDLYFEALLLAPISIVLEHRNKGIGSALINESFRLAHNMGYKAVFLCGDPNYYHRFGFKSIRDFNIKSSGNIPDKFVMAYELYPNALKSIYGTIDFC